MAVLNLGSLSPTRYVLSEDTTAYNPDTAVSVLVGDTPSPDTPIPPQGAFTLAGGRPYWFQRADGSPGVVDLLRGLSGAIPSPIQIATGLTNSGLASAIAADIIAAGAATSGNQTGAGALATAAAIASGSVGGTPGGVPLLHGFTNVSNQTVALAAGGSASVFLSPPKTAYQIGIFARYHGATGANPFVQANVRWYDGGTNFTLGGENWYFPVSITAGFYPILGRGPTKGPTLEITFTNLDTGQPVDVFYQLEAMTQYAERDDWRAPNPVTGGGIPGFTGHGDPQGLMLLSENPNLAASGGNVQYLLPLYAGQVQLNILPTTPQPFSITATTAVIMGNSGVGQFFSASYTAAAPPTVPNVLNLPRCPCSVSITNQGAAAASFLVTAVPIEFAS